MNIIQKRLNLISEKVNNNLIAVDIYIYIYGVVITFFRV